MTQLYSNFWSRTYSVFFMGSPSIKSWTRITALKYMMDPLLYNLNPFGILNPHGSRAKPVNISQFPLCNNSKPPSNWISVPLMPCVMSDNLFEVMNPGNKLYIYGMENSKFNLMLQGDSPTSGKFYDSISFNMINIFVGISEQTIFRYLPFADIVPYRKFCFFISPKDFMEKGLNILHD